MNPAPEHDPELLGSLAAYALGALEQEDARAMEAHLATCAPCNCELAELRELRAVLSTAPLDRVLPDAPPPQVSEALVQRTEQAVREQSPARTRLRSRAVRPVVAAAVAVLGLGGAVLVGRATSPDHGGPVVAQSTARTATSAPSAAPSAPVKVASRTDPRTGARIVVNVTPAAGWIRLNASVAGVPAGEKCRLVVVARDGTREVAVSWLVSPADEKNGSNLDGGAAVALERVRAVEVRNAQGKTLVTVPV
ncbi:anti-sigma factor family protein [Streptomyces sp. 7N604]|uniref:anti-sigma factor family protein n=1 Tax=Streptomyces sp. 7N604 TaxID=3457415 RepID=UPI003FCF891A